MVSQMKSNNYVLVKVCSRNITDSTNLAYRKKSNCKFLSGFPFKAFHYLFLGKEKSWKYTYFATGHCFIHPFLIFVTQRVLIIWLQDIKLCISLHNQSLWILCITLCHERSFIINESYFAEVVNKTLNA